MKQTDSTHKDFTNLENAFEKIEMVVTIVNEASRQAEAVRKMLSIQQRFADVHFILFIFPNRILFFSKSNNFFFLKIKESYIHHTNSKIIKR